MDTWNGGQRAGIIATFSNFFQKCAKCTILVIWKTRDSSKLVLFEY